MRNIKKHHHVTQNEEFYTHKKRKNEKARYVRNCEIYVQVLFYLRKPTDFFNDSTAIKWLKYVTAVTIYYKFFFYVFPSNYKIFFDNYLKFFIVSFKIRCIININTTFMFNIHNII